MLRFQIALEADDELEALRYARRAMIREERTRGLEWDEPSMEDPSLAGHEIRWFALASQAAWCRQKVGELDRAREPRRRGDAGDRRAESAPALPPVTVSPLAAAPAAGASCPASRSASSRLRRARPARHALRY